MLFTLGIWMLAGLLLSWGLTLLAMPPLIRYLHKIKFGQSEREEGLESHKKKTGTPTMGGVAFICISSLIYLILSWFSPWKMTMQSGIILMAFIGYGLIGLLDDWLIVVRKNNDGLKPAYKFGLQALLAVVFFLIYRNYSSTAIWVPGFDVWWNLGWLYFFLVFIMFTAETNAVNLSDGVDGLCAGLMVIALIPFAVFAMLDPLKIAGTGTVAILLSCVIGSLLGYLHFNRHPAQVFMGDTGSLALGGLIAAAAMVLKEEILLIVIGFVFVAEVLSVIIQVSYFKRTGKRIFLMAPLHHHYEKKGWPEEKVVTRFYAAGIVFALIGLILGFI